MSSHSAFAMDVLNVLLTVCTDAARPSYQEEYGRKHKTPWNDLFIDELKRGLVACRVFVFYPIYWVVYSQMLNNFVSQAATMELHNIPNDIMQVRSDQYIALARPIPAC